jgi:hypothetical protein
MQMAGGNLLNLSPGYGDVEVPTDEPFVAARAVATGRRAAQPERAQ